MGWAGLERRRFPRAEFPCKIRVSLERRPLESHTKNISTGGIRVFLEKKFHLNDMVQSKLFLKEDKTIRCIGRIVWVIETINPVEGKPTMFDTGIQFVDMDKEDREYVTRVVNALLSAKKASENTEG